MSEHERNAGARTPRYVDDGHVTGILTPGRTDVARLPSEGGPGLEPGHAAGWLVALAVAGVLIACSWALMTVVRLRSASVTPGSGPGSAAGSAPA